LKPGLLLYYVGLAYYFGVLVFAGRGLIHADGGDDSGYSQLGRVDPLVLVFFLVLFLQLLLPLFGASLIRFEERQLRQRRE
jgi:hypothetical protein